jgi:hypothetical protein
VRKDKHCSKTCFWHLLRLSGTTYSRFPLKSRRTEAVQGEEIPHPKPSSYLERKGNKRGLERLCMVDSAIPALKDRARRITIRG